MPSNKCWIKKGIKAIPVELKEGKILNSEKKNYFFVSDTLTLKRMIFPVLSDQRSDL